MKKIILYIIAMSGCLALNAQLNNYNFSASTGTFSAIAGGTAVSSVEADDAVSVSLPIGFTFNYRGVDYSKIRASSNGWLTFDTSSTPTGFQQRTNDLANNSIFRPLIAPLWDDLDGTSGTASYNTTGTSPNRVYTFEWRNYEWNFQATSPVISFQVKLYETSNNIEFIYRPESGTISANASASVGITDTATGSGSFLSVSDLLTTASVSSTTETANINRKPASGLTFSFSRCTAALSTIGPVCENSGTLNLNSGSGMPSGGMGSYQVNGVSTATFDPASVGRGNHTISYIYSVGGCIDTVKQVVRVDSVTQLNFFMPSNICSNADSLVLTGSPTGGSYSGLGIDNTSNKLVPSNAGTTGIKFVTYSFTNTLGCSDSIQSNYYLDTITKSTVSIPSPTCSNAPQLNLNSGTPGGGTYYGANVSGGSVYQPTMIGMDTVFYVYQVANGCADTSFATTIVNSAPGVNFRDIGRFCENAQPITLNTATPKGGIYKGDNVIDSTYYFNQTGVDTVFYVYTNSDNCSDSSFQIVEVDSVTNSSLASIGPFCDNSPAVMLSGGAPSGGSYLGIGVSNMMYDPKVKGAGFDSLLYAFTNAYGCSDTSLQIVTVNPAPSVTYSSNLVLCEQDDKLLLTGGLPVGGTYTGNGVSNGELDPGVAGFGVDTIKYIVTNGSNCSDSASAQVIINSNPVFSLGADVEICGDADAELDAGIDSVSYLWSNGATGRKITVQESKVFSVTVTDTANGCASSDEVRVEYDAICLSTEESPHNRLVVNYYPNPTSGLLNVTLEGFTDKDLTIDVVNVVGEVVREKQVYHNDNESIILDLSNLKSGTYFVRLLTSNGAIVQPIQKH